MWENKWKNKSKSEINELFGVENQTMADNISNIEAAWVCDTCWQVFMCFLGLGNNEKKRKRKTGENDARNLLTLFVMFASKMAFVERQKLNFVKKKKIKKKIHKILCTQ